MAMLDEKQLTHPNLRGKNEQLELKLSVSNDL